MKLDEELVSISLISLIRMIQLENIDWAISVGSGYGQNHKKLNGKLF
jgi:protein gp37